jgi:L-lactate dehydrogenase complex protein LldE
MVRHHYEGLAGDEAARGEVKAKTFELCEFLHDVVQVTPPTGSFPHVVGLHQSCHGLRELRMGNSSEQAVASYSKVRSLLRNIEGVRFAELARPDECCGFGGSFAVDEEAVSCMMGRDRIADHLQAGAEVLTAADMSCLMHMDGLLRRQKQPMRVMHVAELLMEALGTDTDSTPGR